MKTTAKPAGPVEFEKHRRVVEEIDEPFRTICDLTDSEFPVDDEDQHGEFIADAFNVCHETGLSPRELLDQRDTLSETLKKASAIIAELIRNESCNHAVGICYCDAALALDMIDAATDLMTNAKKEEEPRFENVGCSQCGQSFGPGDHGFSYCENHAGRSPKP